MMRKAGLLVSLAITVPIVIWGYRNSVSSAGGPVDQFPLPEVSFGQVASGVQVREIVCWTNPGPGPAVVEIAKASCSCLSVKTPDDAVPKGAELQIELELVGPRHGGKLAMDYNVILEGGRRLFGSAVVTVLNPPFLDPRTVVVRVPAVQEAWTASTLLVLPWPNAHADIEIDPMHPEVVASLGPAESTTRGTEHLLSLRGPRFRHWAQQLGLATGLGSTTIDIDVSTPFGDRHLRAKVVFETGAMIDATPRKLLLATGMVGYIQLAIAKDFDPRELKLETDPPGCAHLDFDAESGRVAVDSGAEAQFPFDVVITAGGSATRIPVAVLEEIR